MSSNNEKSFACQFLDKYPNLRDSATESTEFALWKSKFPTIDLDGVKLYLLGGASANKKKSMAEAPSNEAINPGADQPKDEDELILLWARQKGLVSKKQANEGL